MSFSDWINFAALANIIAFLWVFRASLAREDRVTAVRDALRLKTGNLPFKAWWIAFLLSVSYRLGATASATPEAVAYGLFPTLLLALLLIDLAKASAGNGRGAWWNAHAKHMHDAYPNATFSRLGLYQLAS